MFTQCIAAARYTIIMSPFQLFFVRVILREGGFIQGLVAYLIPPITLYCMFKLVCDIQVLFD